MAKLTGQFTTPRFDAENNKTHEAFLHAVVFVFTSDTTKVTRETDAKGKYSFDLANGEYEVSVYLKGNTEKDRFDMRAGEKFVVTATTKAGALDEWLQVIGTSGKDELATYYENLLAQMEKFYDDTKSMRDDMVSNSVGSGKWLKKGAGGWCSLASQKTPLGHDLNSRLESGVYSLYAGLSNNPRWQASGDSLMTFGWGNTYYIDLVFGTAGEIAISGTRNGIKSRWYDLYTQRNTTVDSNGNIKAASPIVKLFNNHIESNDSFTEKPIFEKLDTGVYKISNTPGLAKEGWYIETPKDKNGLPYFMVDWEQDKESHDVIIRVFKKKLDLETLDFVNGEPVDIGKDQRWIDLRFHEEPQEADDEELLTQLDNLDESAH